MHNLTNIFRDLGVPLPTTTRWVRDFGNNFGSLLTILLGIWLIGLIGRQTSRAFQKIPPPPGLWWDALIWRLPLFGAVARGKAIADATGVIADALASGRPMDGALADAQSLRGNKELRNRILRWSEFFANGASLDAAARQARLPDLFCGTLAMARLTGSEVEAFRFLERYYRDRFSRAAILIRAALLPVLIFTMGAVVLIIAMAVITPLTNLVDSIVFKQGVL